MVIGVIIVTFNRLEKLKIALQSFEAQISKPQYIIVVNNASTDGTKEFLTKWKQEKSDYEREVYTNNTNEGGSGGFYRGFTLALQKDAEWIWASDDDAFPEETALAEAEKYIKSIDATNYSAICGCVINNGIIDVVHRKNIYQKGLRIIEESVDEREYSKKSFPINAFSYVGAIISKNKMRQVGVTKKDYFIWFDDNEHALRLSAVGKIDCVPSIRIHHDDAGSQTALWKAYYGMRNKIDMFRKNFSPLSVELFCVRWALPIWKRKILRCPRDIDPLYWAGIKDAKKGKLGVHSCYRPGYKSEK